jgi:cholinesterase
MVADIPKAFVAFYLFLVLFVEQGNCNPTAPIVKTMNGTYTGSYLPEWQQETFLGVPYALPPIGPLRFARPHYINTTFDGVRNATNYGPAVRKSDEVEPCS